jgi:hypothetical protein
MTLPWTVVRQEQGLCAGGDWFADAAAHRHCSGRSLSSLSSPEAVPGAALLTAAAACTAGPAVTAAAADPAEVREALVVAAGERGVMVRVPEEAAAEQCAAKVHEAHEPHEAAASAAMDSPTPTAAELDAAEALASAYSAAAWLLPDPTASLQSSCHGDAILSHVTCRFLGCSDGLSTPPSPSEHRQTPLQHPAWAAPGSLRVQASPSSLACNVIRTPHLPQSWGPCLVAQIQDPRHVMETCSSSIWLSTGCPLRVDA